MLALPRTSPSRRSLWALDALNFFLADVRDGLGPYLAIYLSLQKWQPGTIGIAMSAMGVATVIAQTPAGALIDATRHKRITVILAALAVALGSIAMVERPTLPVIVSAQVVLGAAAAVFPPAVAAITLGLMGHRLFGRRTGRNEAFNHAGNVAAAVAAGLIGDHIAYEGIFYLLAGMCLASSFSTLLIRGGEIDYDGARGSGHEPPWEESTDPVPDREPARIAKVEELLEDPRIVLFSIAVVLFHFANAAMLPLVGQKLTAGRADGAAGYMSACIIAAQLVMVPVALLAARLAETWGRKATFLIGFAVLPPRGLLYTLTDNPYALVAIQVLDGIGAGIFGVVGVLVIADLTEGTGRFNLMQGALATAIGIGAALSNVLTGYVVQASSQNVGFLVLAIIAAAALAFYAIFVPETHAGCRNDASRALLTTSDSDCTNGSRRKAANG
ncbi:MAG TPA: MFS transporter [Pirellulales bacterium]|nr:MFS transporter [Pirellulales bacterium]